jgi:hypothetical protein
MLARVKIVVTNVLYKKFLTEIKKLYSNKTNLDITSI